MKVEKLLGSLLSCRGLTIALAESCTGGLAADQLTNVPGSSDYFAGGVVAYSNDAKTALLGVKPATLRRWGAVSSQTVVQMARGAAHRFGTDVAIAVSGIAGPEGGTRAKPVGLVYVAVIVGENAIVKTYRFKGTRRRVKEQAARAALALCLRTLVQT
ncbi:nicotinamide-nucleotide amidohydrolase family protein [candidate division WOR-3 bacterium]|nr:nicotinamide-nucleotide amidohydrolase family protein [candidate division WOR-3 bacterium]